MTVVPSCYPGATRLAAALQIAGFSPDHAASNVVDVTGAVYPYSELLVALAIGAAESSGNAWAVGPRNTDGSHDRGFLQINDKAHDAEHPDWFVSPSVTSLNWQKYTDNCVMGFAVYEEAGGVFHPWTCYNTGAYLGWHYQGIGLTRLGWAQAGINGLNARLQAGAGIDYVASIRLEAWQG